MASFIDVRHAVLGACGDEVGDSFFNFVDRADREPPVVEEIGGQGVLMDVRGEYLFNISLRVIGEVFLPLKVRFDEWELTEPADGSPAFAVVSGGFYFPDDGPDAAPLAAFQDTVLDASGRMELDLGYVRIEPERSPIKDTAVEVDFKLQVVVLSETEMCGVIDDEESAVYQPIQIFLRGVNFAAERYGADGTEPVDVPTECPVGFGGVEGSGEGSGEEPDDGSGEGSGEPITIPDVDIGEGVRADISGRYWLQVNINGAIPLDLLAYTRIREEGDTTYVDGSLYLPRNGLERPPVGSFTSEVDENGRFIATVRNLRVVTTITVEANIAMLASIKSADLWCGAAGGEVFSPPIGELLDTTFAAVRYDTDEQPPFETGFRPDSALARCPD